MEEYNFDRMNEPNILKATSKDLYYFEVGIKNCFTLLGSWGKQQKEKLPSYLAVPCRI